MLKATQMLQSLQLDEKTFRGIDRTLRLEKNMIQLQLVGYSKNLARTNKVWSQVGFALSVDRTRATGSRARVGTKKGSL